jgi:hypothetical protein
VKVSAIFALARRNLTKLEATVAIAALVGAAITLAIGGSGGTDTIRMNDVSSSLSPPYGELNSSSMVGYADNFSRWNVSPPSTPVTLTRNSLLLRGGFPSASIWQSIVLFKDVNVDITSYPILNMGVNVTQGVQYGIRFYSQYPNGTEYNVWWEGSPLDHRSGVGYESLRINMQREAVLATGHPVQTINEMELYVGDPPHSPQSFQLTLSNLSFDDYRIEQVSNNRYHAIYFDIKNPPHPNASWYLNKITLGVTIQASQGSMISIYLFDGSLLYASTTASGLPYDPITSFSEYTFYPNLQPQVFPELLPRSDQSIVFVAASGTLQSVIVNSSDFEFLPNTVIPGLPQQSLGLYYVYFIFFLFLLPVGVAVLVFREFLSRKLVPQVNIVIVLVVGIMCRTALAATTAHVFDMNVYLTSTRGWFQYRNPLGSLGPTLPLTYFLYWISYSPYALLQIAGFQDVQFLGHAAGLVESFFVKLFPMLMDALIFLVLFRFRTNGASFVWATFYFLNPLAIFTSSVWGQYEAATLGFLAFGIYRLSLQKDGSAALAFIVSGMIELLGFLPYLILLLRTARMKIYKTLILTTLAALPIALYPPEADLIFRILLSLTGFLGGQFSRPGPYSLFGSFPQLSIIGQFKPMLLGQVVVLGAASLDIYRQKMSTERLVFYTVLSSAVLLLFSNLVSSWLWLVPVCLLYAIMKEKNDLGAFILVYGTSVAFLEVSNLFGSAYLLLGTVGYPILPMVEAVTNRVQIFTAMVTSLTIILLFFLRYGSGRPNQTLLRTSGMTLSLYLLLYFWLSIYPIGP